MASSGPGHKKAGIPLLPLRPPVPPVGSGAPAVQMTWASVVKGPQGVHGSVAPAQRSGLAQAVPPVHVNLHPHFLQNQMYQGHIFPYPYIPGAEQLYPQPYMFPPNMAIPMGQPYPPTLQSPAFQNNFNHSSLTEASEPVSGNLFDDVRQLEANKGGVVILQPRVDFGYCEPSLRTAPPPQSLTIFNTALHAVCLRSIMVVPNENDRFVVSKTDDERIDHASMEWRPMLIAPQTAVSLSVKFRPGLEVTACRSWAILSFDAESFGRPAQPIVIGRRMLAMVQLKEDRDTMLNPDAAPYFPRAVREVFESHPAGGIVEGESPGSKLGLNLVELGWYPLPVEVPSVTSMHSIRAGDMATYRRSLHVMLWAEEAKTIEDVKSYDMFYVDVSSVGRGVARITVPGLSEQRPEVIVGSSIRLRRCDAPYAQEYKCFVHSVSRGGRVDFMWPFDFVENGLKVHVRFCIQRSAMIAMHSALDHVERVRVYPEEADLPKEVDDTAISPINSSLNCEQQLAVRRIVHNTHGRAPFVIFGPPGTGKTVTAVEAILQILLKDSTRVLVTAPSPSAADVIALKLAEHLGTSDMILINSWQRAMNTVRPPLLPYCKNDDGFFSLPQSVGDDHWSNKYRVVVSTCTGCDLIVSHSGPQPSFTHIFVDESAQGMEPEVLIPFQLASDHTQVILAGDHCQLGPIVRSVESADGGLGMSLQERLMKHNPLYSGGSSEGKVVDDRVMVKLLNNYRSHDRILELPSQLFYKAELRPFADRQVVESLSEWSALPNKKQCPVMFYGIAGQEIREGESTSFFNPVEASKVVELIQSLLDGAQSQEEGGFVVTVNDIGVMAPYRKQVEKIRLLLRGRGLGAVRVGTVEDYQGQEERIVFISTVVSTGNRPLQRKHSALSDKPLRSFFGFMRSAKRFNVALTRAKALLVVVGNPTTLANDPYWKAFIQYCGDKDCYSGCACSLVPDSGAKSLVLGGGSVNEATMRMARLIVGGVDDEDEGMIDDWSNAQPSFAEEMPFRVQI